MKIFYVSVIDENAGWGAEWFLNNAFHSLGHSTHCLDYRKHKHRLYRQYLRVPQSDVLLLQRGDCFPLQLVRAVQVPRFFWNSELVSRCYDNHHLLKSGLFDHIFFRTDACIDTVVKNGWISRDKCSVLLSCFDETIHRYIPNSQKDIDVLFVGSMNPRRQYVIDKLRRQFKVVVAAAYGREMAVLLNRAKIVLNIHAEDFPDTETRVFEVLGCGAFLLTEHLSPENPFTQGELVEYSDVNDLIRKIDFYLAHSGERTAIAEKGYAAAMAKHTYSHRAQEIVAIMCAQLGRRSRGVATVKRDWKLYAFGRTEPFYRMFTLSAKAFRLMIKRGLHLR